MLNDNLTKYLILNNYKCYFLEGDFYFSIAPLNLPFKKVTLKSI
jgi:hypothetical protein